MARTTNSRKGGGKNTSQSSARGKKKSVSGKKRWVRGVMQTSDALDLEQGVFKKDSPRAVARSLKRSAEQSHRRKSDPYRSAMSMLTFHINRSGKDMPKSRRRTLEQAKDELRDLYGRERKGSARGGKTARKGGKD